MKPVSVWEKLKDLDRFFQGRDPVHQTMRRAVRRLNRAHIPYAVVGGMAVVFQGYRRTTNDVDLLLTRDGLAEFQRRFVPKNYRPFPGRGRRFIDRVNEVTIDILVTGAFPGAGRPGPVAFPDPNDVGTEIERIRVLDLPTLIQLKLAARRHQDFADVVHLIRAHQLEEAFANRLHPSLRQDYIECLEEKRREDEYEAREG
jgi:hypothetical protein